MVSREWSSYEAALAYYIAEGFEVVSGTCTACGLVQHFVAWPGTRRCQCPSCGALYSVEIKERYGEP